MPKGEKSRVYLGSRVPGRVRRVHKPRYTLFASYGLVLLFAFQELFASFKCVLDKFVLCLIFCPGYLSIYVVLCSMLTLCRYPCLSCLCHACFLKILVELIISQICVHCIQKQILQVHTLRGSSSNIFHGNICLKLIIISFFTLARFVIVNQKRGDCKGILTLTIILANDDTGAKVSTNVLYKYIYRHFVHKCW